MDEDGEKNYDLEILWRIASKKELLYCDECNEIVFLNRQISKIPHFSQWPNFSNNCSKVKKANSNQYMSLKKQLYDSLKKFDNIDLLEVDPRNKNDFYFKIFNREFNITFKKIA